MYKCGHRCGISFCIPYWGSKTSRFLECGSLDPPLAVLHHIPLRLNGGGDVYFLGKET